MDAEPLFTDLHTILDILKYINYTEKLKESLPTVIGIFLVQDINSFLKDFFSWAHRVFPQSTMLHQYTKPTSWP